MRYPLLIAILSLSLIHGCTDKDSPEPHNSSIDNDAWLVDKTEIVNWDAEKDRIQSIDTLEFIALSQSNLADEEPVFALHHNGITKIYPVSVMGGHEIANDQIDDFFFSLTYCPITASAVCWNRTMKGKVNQFGVSGMLYKENLIPYDRLTGSYWSQMGNLCVNGEFTGEEPKTIQLIETTFSTIKVAYPDALILDHHHCEDGICIRHKSSADAGEPGDEYDDILVDSRYFGIARNDEALLFGFDLFGENTQLYQVNFKGQNLVIAGNSSLNYFAAFVYIKDSPNENIFAVENELPLIMADSKGNKYDIFGNILSGPDKGKRLSSPVAYRANTFAWKDHFTEIKVYSE